MSCEDILSDNYEESGIINPADSSNSLVSGIVINEINYNSADE